MTAARLTEPIHALISVAVASRRWLNVMACRQREQREQR